MRAKGYSQAIQTIKNTINRALLMNDLATSSQDIHALVSNRQLLAGDLLEKKNTTVSKMEILQNEELSAVATHKKYLLVQTEGKRRVSHYGIESWRWRR